MKTIAAVLSLLLALGPAAMAAAPQRVLYQGTLRRSGALFTGNATFLFRVTDASGGTQYWTSGSTVVAVNSGLFRYPLGITNTGADGGFPSVSWASIDPYVEVTVDGTVLSPREPMVSVPYALYNLNIANVNKYGDSMIGPLTMWASSITIVNQISTAAFSLAVTTATDRGIYHLYVATTGRVGIGTSTPGARLEVAGGDLYVSQDNSGIAILGGDIGLAKKAGDSGFWAVSGTTEHSWAKVTGSVLGGGGVKTEQMRLTTAGDLGVGFNAPQGRLEVRPEAANNYSLFVSSQNGNLLLGVDKAGDVYVGAHAHALSAGDLSANPDLLVGGNIVVDGQFVSHNGIGSSVTFTSAGDFIIGTSTLVVTQGRIGIGTTAPLATFHGVGPVNTTSNPALWRAAAIFDNAATSTLLPLEFRVAGTVRSTMRSDSNGNLVLNGTGTGSTYLNYDSGTGGITFGNGAGSSIGSIGNTGNLSLNGTGTFGTNAVFNGGGNSWFNGGSLGIGTTSPAQKLEVYNGNAKISNGTPQLILNDYTGGADSQAWRIMTNGGSLWHQALNDAGTVGTSYLYVTRTGMTITSASLLTGGVERLFSNQAGNIGIGTTSPGLARLRLQGTTADNYHLHITSANGTTDLLVVTSSGAVGINTTNPGAKLHVTGNAFIDTSGTSAATRHVTIKSGGGQFDWGNYAGNWAPSLMLQGVTAGGAESAANFLFLSALDDTQPARMTTTKGLEIYTGAVLSPASSGNLALAFDSTGRAAVGGSAAPASTRLWVQGAAADDFHLQVSSQNGSTPLLAVNKAGNVGIGTTNPSSKLNVSGDVLVLSGGLGVNVAPSPNVAIVTNRTLTGNVDSYGVFSNPNGASDVTTSLQGVYSKVQSVAAVYTLSNAQAFHAANPGVGAGSTITNAYGLNIDPQKVAGVTNGYGIYQTGGSDINYFAGNAGIGTTAPGTKLHVSSGVLTLDGTTAGASIDADKAADHLALIRNRNATGLGLRVVAGADTLAALTVNDATDSSNKHLLYGNGKAVFGFNGGNVGINTINPAFKLHISSGSLVVDGNGGKIETASGGTATTIACASGAGEAFVGNDMAGRITIGALGAAACTVTFATAYTNEPICTAGEQTTPAAIAVLPAAGSLVLTATFVAADVINYICIGRR